MQERFAGMIKAGIRHDNVVLSFIFNTQAWILELLRVLSAIGEKNNRFEV